MDVMKKLAADGMTMVIVTHEMGFAAKVADRVFAGTTGAVARSASEEISRKVPACS